MAILGQSIKLFYERNGKKARHKIIAKTTQPPLPAEVVASINEGNRARAGLEMPASKIVESAKEKRAKSIRNRTQPPPQSSS